ncbi:FAD/NAD(P)-binding protein [Enterococcus pseudoavium]|uniref:FAD/NAD(P)-binding protein n=1 Tax=Enterococcus pseudoavium TaxID=44007 RepID=A0ABU3FFG3_9ENTE|nr:FAD/NAD(P)-binding protein [Enterococcus pseudoavium]MDT2755272.1 FAD/NAD(P)-binding protein [Enterococcus pseudoavium]MDT2769778.1 FAD/NAD(P)-binding protein [Enterococcus pseudoavium]
MKRVAIIGAGPCGLSMLDRLIKQAPANEKIEILLFDPDGPGGKVWRADQNDQVMMNTVMQHVTLFSEDEGPNLAEWNQTEARRYLSALKLTQTFATELQLDPNDYCQRRYYGVYQRWFFSELIHKLPENIKVTLIEETVVDLTLVEKSMSLHASKHYPVDQVILTTGHAQNELSEAEMELQTYADTHGLFYQGPANPSDAALDELVTGEPVILRGLGLSFFDYLALLVARWGGKFVETGNGLSYEPSGKEQLLIVGSGRGLPYHARPKNQKEPGEDAVPQMLTEAFMTQFQGSAVELFDLLKKEAELVFYQKKLAASEIDVASFLAEYRKGQGENVLTKYRIPPEQRLVWQKLFDPAKEVEPSAFPTFVEAYLKKDIAEAELGNQRGAIAAAIDTYKELQAPLNYMLDHEHFTAKEYFTDFLGRFNHNYRFLTIGPPVIRQKQLLALAEAGIVEFLAPEMVVEGIDGTFLTYSKKHPQRSFSAKNLIEARLPTTDLKRTKNPLVVQLREKGYVSPHVLKFDDEKQPTGALLVQRSTHQVIDQKGRVLPQLYCFGIPLEGLDWLNAASPRPKSKDRIFYLAAQIAKQIYK